MYLIGPGNKAPGKKRLNEKLSCSKNDKVPSIDCTQIKSLPEKKKNQQKNRINSRHKIFE
jgi:hypothetical protein